MELGDPKPRRLEPTLRPARVEDAPGLAHAQRAIAATPGLLVSQPDEISGERLAEKIAALGRADNGRFLVAEVDGEIVAHGFLDPIPFAALRHVTVLTMAVHVGWQGRGAGRALLGGLIDWAREAPAVEKIELHVRASNAPARALYRGLGFAEVGRWRRRVRVAADRYVDDLTMELFVK